jgi:hypothetical protein
LSTLETNHAIATVSYDTFLNGFDWRQGEHITLVGTTGCGKTTLENSIEHMRDYVMFLSTKPQDETQEELGPLGYHTAKSVKDVVLDVSHKWVIAPGVPRKMEPDQIKEHQRKIFGDAMMYCFHQTGWTVIIDEGRYICDVLQLKQPATVLYLQGRSGYNSVVMGTQRPRWVPLESFDAATHLFIWRDNDANNIQRIGELTGMNYHEVEPIVKSLEMKIGEGGQFLYYNTRTGDMMISKVIV